MPGEERKFRRRSIVAFIPTCNREREVAASHTSVSDGVCTVGVGNGSGIGDSVAVGIDVEGSAGVDVLVGEGITTKVAVDVSVGDDIGSAVIVTVLDVDVSVWDGVGGAAVVVTSLVAVGETGGPVGVDVSTCGAFAGIQNNKQINISRSMSAMTSLNRS